jgi:hypothetical protein
MGCRLQDRPITRASTQVPGNGFSTSLKPPRFSLRAVGLGLSTTVRACAEGLFIHPTSQRHHKAGRTKTTLSAVCLDQSSLSWMQNIVTGQALDRDHRLPMQLLHRQNTRIHWFVSMLVIRLNQNGASATIP